MIAKWIFKQFMRFQIFMYRRSNGKRMGVLRGVALLVLTTVGRKTGIQRETIVMYIRDDDNYVITASNNGGDKDPAWFVNLQANPQATIEVEGTTKSVLAHQANPEEKERLWAQLVKKAPFFEGYKQKTTREIPMMILQPTGSARK